MADEKEKPIESFRKRKRSCSFEDRAKKKKRANGWQIAITQHGTVLKIRQFLILSFNSLAQSTAMPRNMISRHGFRIC